MRSFVNIGRVTAPHGISGEVRVLPLTDFPERFHGLVQVYLSRPMLQKAPAAFADESVVQEPEPKAVLAVRSHKQFIIMKFVAINDRDEAASLRGALVQVPLSEAYPLPPDTHYVFQLLGLAVYTQDGRRLGVVRDVMATGANDVYVIKRAEGGPDLLIPALRHVVLDIDLEQRRIEVQLLPGLE